MTPLIFSLNNLGVTTSPHVVLKVAVILRRTRHFNLGAFLQEERSPGSNPTRRLDQIHQVRWWHR
jgi:hypothetical protein